MPSEMELQIFFRFRTWRRTVEEEMKTMGKTWHELQWLAQDRTLWRSFVGALCPPSGPTRIE